MPTSWSLCASDPFHSSTMEHIVNPLKRANKIFQRLQPTHIAYQEDIVKALNLKKMRLIVILRLSALTDIQFDFWLVMALSKSWNNESM